MAKFEDHPSVKALAAKMAKAERAALVRKIADSLRDISKRPTGESIVVYEKGSTDAAHMDGYFQGWNECLEWVPRYIEEAFKDEGE